WGWEEGGKKEPPKEQPKEPKPEPGAGEKKGGKGGDGGWGSEGEGWEGDPQKPPAHPGEEDGDEEEDDGFERKPGKAARMSLTAWFLGAIPLSGEAGSGDQAPGWADAYGFGFGGGAALGYRLLPCLGAQFFLYYQSLPARPFTSLGIDNELSDFKFVGLGIGPRFYVLLDRSVDMWFGPADKPFKGLAFLIGYDFGIGFSSPVAWEAPAPAWDYWEGGVILVQEAVVGLEYRLASAFGVFLEAGLATTSGPKASSGPANPMNEAGSLSALRFRIGLLLAF
ncbi:MAG: hypothetical protein MUC63_05075, partial [Planctomycetes bacterium]|nr:hypothetical protein [Planctomycetota bacterium]